MGKACIPSGIFPCKRLTRSKNKATQRRGQRQGQTQPTLHTRSWGSKIWERMCVTCPSELRERKMVTMLCVPHTHTHMHTRTHAHIHAHTHAQTHARTHTRTHTNTHTHTHTCISAHKAHTSCQFTAQKASPNFQHRLRCFPPLVPPGTSNSRT